MKHASWVLLVILVVGCGRSGAKPAAITSQLTADPMPPEVAKLIEQGDHQAALGRMDQLIAATPGDAILPEKLEYLATVAGMGVYISGASDHSLATIKVVDKQAVDA